MESMAVQIVAIGVTVGTAGAGAIAGVLKWSFGRNLKEMDAKIDELRAEVKSLKANAIDAGFCSSCRRECQDRISTNQREILEWMRRQDDKTERVLMMMVNAHSVQAVTR